MFSQLEALDVGHRPPEAPKSAPTPGGGPWAPQPAALRPEGLTSTFGRGQGLRRGWERQVAKIGILGPLGPSPEAPYKETSSALGSPQEGRR